MYKSLTTWGPSEKWSAMMSFHIDGDLSLLLTSMRMKSMRIGNLKTPGCPWQQDLSFFNLLIFCTADSTHPHNYACSSDDPTWPLTDLLYRLGTRSDNSVGVTYHTSHQEAGLIDKRTSCCVLEKRSVNLPPLPLFFVCSEASSHSSSFEDSHNLLNAWINVSAAISWPVDPISGHRVWVLDDKDNTYSLTCFYPWQKCKIKYVDALHRLAQTGLCLPLPPTEKKTKVHK